VTHKFVPLTWKQARAQAKRMGLDIERRDFEMAGKAIDAIAPLFLDVANPLDRFQMIASAGYLVAMTAGLGQSGAAKVHLAQAASQRLRKAVDVAQVITQAVVTIAREAQVNRVVDAEIADIFDSQEDDR
jgi:hypothetical protein